MTTTYIPGMGEVAVSNVRVKSEGPFKGVKDLAIAELKAGAAEFSDFLEGAAEDATTCKAYSDWISKLVVEFMEDPVFWNRALEILREGSTGDFRNDENRYLVICDSSTGSLALKDLNEQEALGSEGSAMFQRARMRLRYTMRIYEAGDGNMRISNSEIPRWALAFTGPIPGYKEYKGCEIVVLKDGRTRTSSRA